MTEDKVEYIHHIGGIRKVDSPEGFPDHVTDQCSRCEAEVWVSPASEATARMESAIKGSAEPIVVCNRCSVEDAHGGGVLAIHFASLPEDTEAGRYSLTRMFLSVIQLPISPYTDPSLEDQLKAQFRSCGMTLFSKLGEIAFERADEYGLLDTDSRERARVKFTELMIEDFLECFDQSDLARCLIDLNDGFYREYRLDDPLILVPALSSLFPEQFEQEGRLA